MFVFVCAPRHRWGEGGRWIVIWRAVDTILCHENCEYLQGQRPCNCKSARARFCGNSKQRCTQPDTNSLDEEVCEPSLKRIRTIPELKPTTKPRGHGPAVQEQARWFARVRLLMFSAPSHYPNQRYCELELVPRSLYETYRRAGADSKKFDFRVTSWG